MRHVWKAPPLQATRRTPWPTLPSRHRPLCACRTVGTSLLILHVWKAPPLQATRRTPWPTLPSRHRLLCTFRNVVTAAAAISSFWLLPKAAEAVPGKPNRTTALTPTAPKNLVVLFLVVLF